MVFNHFKKRVIPPMMSLAERLAREKGNFPIVGTVGIYRLRFGLKGMVFRIIDAKSYPADDRGTWNVSCFPGPMISWNYQLDVQ